jgi:hypothetical protein
MLRASRRAFRLPRLPRLRTVGLGLIRRPGWRAIGMAGAVAAVALAGALVLSPGRAGPGSDRGGVSLLGLTGRSLAGMDGRLAEVGTVRISPPTRLRPHKSSAPRHRCGCARHLDSARSAVIVVVPAKSQTTYVSTSRGYVAPVTRGESSSSIPATQSSHQATTSRAQPAFGANGSLGPGSSPNG